MLKSRLSHLYGSAITFINERYTYDHASRLRSTYHQINDAGPEMRLDSMSYNERDELMQKMISFNGVTPGQTVDYSYNIRKWLTKINDPAVACGSNPDLYSQQLYYDVANASLNATAKYNGNIAWTEWRTNSAINVCTVNGVNRDKAGYGFTYDGLDRMTASKSGEWVSSAWTNFDRYNESNTYDLNGNILTLVRKGYLSAGNYPTVDNLTYTYDGTNIHRVNSIADASGSALGFPAASGSYTYDANGNQISDGAKGFTAITYNHLNLPTKFTQGANTIEIQYDAAGRKLKKISSAGTTKSYIGNIEYVGAIIEAIYHPDGRARNNAGTYVYEYVIKDHLGDTRVAFTNTSGTIALIQENHYYPFGMQQGGWTAEPSPTNAYKYSGKELNVDFGLNLSDYGARWYEGSIARFTTVDPMADKNNYESPFVYVHNNPINAIDPDGKDAILIAFPDYKISTPIGKIGNLGHAGVLLIDNKSGRTKYYEYGRYDKAEVGLVRNVRVANVKIGSDGKPTEKSLQRVLKQISGQSGQNGRIEGAYIESDKFEEMNNYAKERLSQNSDPNRDPYSLTSNNCGTFGCDVVNQDPEVAKRAPSIFDPRPNSIIKEFQGEFGKVKYDPKSGGSVETVDRSKYQEFLDKLKKQFERP